MLKSIKFTKKWRCFEEGFSISFRAGVNLLVGDQGTGKSSMFQALQVHGLKNPKSLRLPRKADVPMEFIYEGEPMPVLAFDFEKDNFRTKTWFDDSSMMFHASAMFVSHGEMVKAMMAQWECVDKPVFVLLDEPDMALSIRSCRQLVQSFKHVAEQGGQVVATAHNPVVIEAFEVCSLEHKRWMPGREFIETQ